MYRTYEISRDKGNTWEPVDLTDEEFGKFALNLAGNACRIRVPIQATDACIALAEMFACDYKSVDYCWLDKDTFKVVFDGGVDEDGDSFFYCCEFWKDVNEWHFQRIYEDDYTDAMFTPEKAEEIKSLMGKLMST